MSWLARLKNHEVPDTDATKPTKQPEQVGGLGFVGFVAHPTAPPQKIEAREAAANDTATPPAVDPDRCCWPHSTAMNGREISTFMARLRSFTDKGVDLTEADRLADKLVARDREGDDRRLCLECAHLGGAGRRRCGNWQRADLGDAALPLDLVFLLQRCHGFQQR